MIWAILSSFADFDAEEPKELTEEDKKYIKKLNGDSLHPNVPLHVATGNLKAKPLVEAAEDTKAKMDNPLGMSIRPKRGRAEPYVKARKKMYFADLIKVKNKDREELRVPELDLPHQEQKERPLRIESKSSGRT